MMQSKRQQKNREAGRVQGAMIGRAGHAADRSTMRPRPLPIEPVGRPVVASNGDATAPRREIERGIDPYRIPEPPNPEEQATRRVVAEDRQKGADGFAPTRQLVYDDTFGGYLAAIFACYHEHGNDRNVAILPEPRFQPDIFSTEKTIFADATKGGRVWHGLLRHLRREQVDDIVATFLGESPAREELMLDYIRKVFATSGKIAENYLDETARNVRVWGRRLQREKHRHEAFVRFGESSTGEQCALIEPEYDVLPLILRHFRERYPDGGWVIYDVKRGYGAHFDGTITREVDRDGEPRRPRRIFGDDPLFLGDDVPGYRVVKTGT